MRRLIIGFAVFCAACLPLFHQRVVGGEIVTPLQTQATSAAGDLVATNWGPGTSGVTDALVFDQFNSKLGTLAGIDITLTTTIRNDYELIFTNSSTITVTNSVPGYPSDGPTVTLFGPNGSTQIFGPPGTTQPVDSVTKAESSGTYSSFVSPTSPYYIAPTNATEAFSDTLTAASAPSLFSDFIGTGTIDLPIDATAYSSFSSSSGNGGGAVFTSARAVVTIQYVYAAPYVYAGAVPEPTSIILLALGFGFSFLASGRLRNRDARTFQDPPCLS